MVNIIVVFPKMEDARNIRNILMRNGYHVSAVCVSGTQALQIADDMGEGLVVCGYKLADMMYDRLKECLPKGFDLLLIASDRLLATCNDPDIVTLSLPLKIQNLINTVALMQETILRKRKKRKSVPKNRSPKEQKLIDDAKKLLMERNNMSEEEAHRYMQKCSMDSGTNLVETAQMVFALMR